MENDSCTTCIDEENLEPMLCSTFCSACQEIFTGNIQRFDDSGLVPHHQSLSEIQSAVQEDCYICSRSYKTWSLKNPDFFTLSSVTSTIKFSMEYQVQFEHDGSNYGDYPRNTIRIVLCCNRHEEGAEAVRCVINFLAFSSEDFPRIAHRPRRTSSPLTLGIAKTWLQNCVSSTNIEHEACNRLRVAGWAPSRLVQVTGKDPNLWYLRLPAEEGLDIQSYTTLSYRWGSESFTKLTASNIQDFCKGSAISALPKTFQDAIKVTRSLGVEFLWVDALCIVQDSIVDWRTESLAMYHVYKNSFCNIAATASHTPYGGLFLQSMSSLGKLGSIKNTWSNLDQLKDKENLAPSLKSIDTVIPHHYVSTEVDSSPLISRAWIFQEFLLAPRILHFLDTQLYWKCHAGSNCETLPSGIIDAPVWDKIDFEKHETDGIPWEHSWGNMITNYSRCSATEPLDKLIALSGVAKFFMEATKTSYVAGMWKDGLEDFLDWKVSDPSSLRPRATPYRAPTWSWASIDSAVDYWDPNHAQTQPMAKAVSVTVSTIGEDSTGLVTGGLLVLRGTALELEFAGSVPDTDYTKWSLGDQSYTATVRYDIADGGLSSTPLVFLAMHSMCRNQGYNTQSLPWKSYYRYPFKVSGLVLTAFPGPVLQYTRVGFFEMKFGLSESEVANLKFPANTAAFNGLDGRMDAPNAFTLAEPFGFKAGDEVNTMVFTENETLLRNFEIV